MNRYSVVFILISSVFKGAMGLIAPIYPLYLRQLGLDDTGIFATNICFYLSFLCFDIPAGKLADKYGHRISIVLGLSLRILGFYMFMSATKWWYFVIGEILIGSGAAFFGSALQAWFVNGMRSKNQDHLIPRVFSFEAGIAGGLLVMAGIFTSLFASRGYPFIYRSLIFIVLFLIILVLLSVNLTPKYKKIEYLKLNFREVASHVDANFFRICLIYFVFFLSTQGINLQWQSWAIQNGFSDSAVSSMFSGMQCIAILSVLFSGWLVDLANDKVRTSWQILILELISLGLFIVTPAILPFSFGIWAIALQSIGRGGAPICCDVILKSAINNDAYRATLTSMASACKNAGAICGLIVGGFFARYCSAHCGWKIGGSILLVGIAIILLTFLSKKGEKQC